VICLFPINLNSNEEKSAPKPRHSPRLKVLVRKKKEASTKK